MISSISGNKARSLYHLFFLHNIIIIPVMKKLLYISFLLLPMFAAAQTDSLSSFEFAKGPVKRIVYYAEQSGGSNFSLYYGNKSGEGMKIIIDFDKAGRVVRQFDTQQSPSYDTLIYIGNKCERWEISPEHPEGTLGAIIRYDSAGRRVSQLYVRADTIYTMDSVVYNQWGKPAMEYTSVSFSKPYSLYMKESYKYDSTGVLIGQRHFEHNKRLPVSGVNYTYSPGKIMMAYVNEKGEVSKSKDTSYYDKEGRLVKYKTKGGTTTYSNYDANGNWQKMVSFVNYEDMPISMSVTFYREIIYYE